MPTYVYETIPQHPGESPVCFEVHQRMADRPLDRHPDTGVPVRRVVTGGAGFICERAADAHGGGCCSCH